MTDDDQFTPALGKPHRAGSKAVKPFLSRVQKAVTSAGGRRNGKGGKFSGSRIGRGTGHGAVLATRSSANPFRRRVVIKSRIVKLKGKSLQAAQVHLRYIQRDGVTREGAPGALYDKQHDQADGKAFLGRCEEDRHQFRFIVSAEDGERYEDLKPFVRRLMAQMEEDLGTKLDWVAVDHFNTGHPHTHIVLRGADDMGKDLIIARDYLSRGMRERAGDIATLDLGPKTAAEIEAGLMREVEQERFTSLDYRLLADATEEGVVQAYKPGIPAFHQTLRAGRLQKLGRLGLATKSAPGVWRLDPVLEPKLHELGLRGDIIKTMHRELTERGIPKPFGEYVIYDPAASRTQPVIGKVVGRGLSDELHDRHYLVVDGTDGYAHYVDIGVPDKTEAVEVGHVVEIAPKRAEIKAVDRLVVEIAAANGGQYNADIHLRYDPSATAEFAATHVRRLEAIRRVVGGVERQPDGTWRIGADHLSHAEAFERRLIQQAPVIVKALSRLSVEQLAVADGATWFDRELTGGQPIPLRESGFGRDVRKGLTRRRQWLVEQQLAEIDGDRTVFRANLMAHLRRRELVRVGAQLSTEMGLTYVPPATHGLIEGRYRKPVELVSGRFAVIQKAGREFTLVPWRPVLERALGKDVSGVARGESISWTIGRQRGRSIT